MNEEKVSHEERGVGFPQILHDRSRDAGRELHKLLLSLSTGSLGVYFFALTTRVEPVLTPRQQWTVMSGMTAMGLATLSGIMDLYADSRRNFFWARALQSEDRKERAGFYKQRDRWWKIERAFGWVLTWTFFAGIVLSMIYVLLRIYAH